MPNKVATTMYVLVGRTRTYPIAQRCLIVMAVDCLQRAGRMPEMTLIGPSAVHFSFLFPSSFRGVTWLGRRRPDPGALRLSTSTDCTRQDSLE